MNNMRIFARITKVDEAKRLVIGRAAQEVVDKDEEVFDYETSKPNFMKWSAEVFAESGGKSYGNMRAMHANIAAGKVTNIDFNDTEKAIDIETKVVDDNEWKKVLEGVYTGFSIGGKYTKKWAAEMDGKMVTRYTANPSEISYVDRPCIPTAKFYEITKADGSVHTRTFKAFDTPTGATTGMSEYDQEGTKPKKKPKKVSQTPTEADFAEARAVKPPKVEVVTTKMQKGMCTVAALFVMLRDLTEMASGLQREQTEEGDKSKIYKEIRDKVTELAEIGGRLAMEEAEEAADDVLNDSYYNVYLYRMAKSVGKLDLRKEGRRNSTEDLGLLQNVHDTVCKLGAACSSGSAEESHDDEFPGEPRKSEGSDMKKSAQSDIKSQASARGASVTDGDGNQAESDNVDDKEKTTAPLGSHGADRGFSSKKAKPKASEQDDEEDEEDDMDDEDEEDEEPKQKPKKAKKSLEARLRKSITSDILDALREGGVLKPPAAAAQDLGVTGAPAVHAVGKDGSVSKATSAEDMKKSVTAVNASKLSGEKDDVATLIKASHLHPMSHSDLYK